MPEKPNAYPDYALDESYTSGPLVGQPTKVALDSDDVNQGNVSGTVAPSRKFNWWQHLVGLWSRFLDEITAYLQESPASSVLGNSADEDAAPEPIVSDEGTLFGHPADSSLGFHAPSAHNLETSTQLDARGEVLQADIDSRAPAMDLIYRSLQNRRPQPRGSFTDSASDPDAQTAVLVGPSGAWHFSESSGWAEITDEVAGDPPGPMSATYRLDVTAQRGVIYTGVRYIAWLALDNEDLGGDPGVAVLIFTSATGAPGSWSQVAITSISVAWALHDSTLSALVSALVEVVPDGGDPYLVLGGLDGSFRRIDDWIDDPSVTVLDDGDIDGSQRKAIAGMAIGQFGVGGSVVDVIMATCSETGATGGAHHAALSSLGTWLQVPHTGSGSSGAFPEGAHWTPPLWVESQGAWYFGRASSANAAVRRMDTDGDVSIVGAGEPYGAQWNRGLLVDSSRIVWVGDDGAVAVHDAATDDTPRRILPAYGDGGVNIASIVWTGRRFILGTNGTRVYEAHSHDHAADADRELDRGRPAHVTILNGHAPEREHYSWKESRMVDSTDDDDHNNGSPVLLEYDPTETRILPPDAVIAFHGTITARVDGHDSPDFSAHVVVQRIHAGLILTDDAGVPIYASPLFDTGNSSVFVMEPHTAYDEGAFDTAVQGAFVEVSSGVFRVVGVVFGNEQNSPRISWSLNLEFIAHQRELVPGTPHVT